MIDIDRIIKKLVLTDASCTISDPVLYNLHDHTIAYCTNPKGYQNISVDFLKKYSLIIVNDSINQGGGNIEFCRFAEENNLNVIVLAGDLQHHQRHSSIYYYPYWYHIARNVLFPKNVYKKNFTTNVKTHSISCLNGNPRWHRIYNYFLLQDKSYFDAFLFSMHWPDVSDHDMQTTWHKLPPDMLQKWANTKGQLATRNDIKASFRIEGDVFHPAYTDSYINLVTETDMDGLFVTEKTWKPIASGQLFLVIGSQHTISYLKDFGVDTFDDIIDHKYYDNESDWQTRIHRVHDLIGDLLQQNLLDLNTQTQHRRLRNAHKFFNENCDKLYQPALEQCIITLKN